VNDERAKLIKKWFSFQAYLRPCPWKAKYLVTAGLESQLIN